MPASQAIKDHAEAFAAAFSFLTKAVRFPSQEM